MFGKKKAGTTNAGRSRTVIRETLERIVIRRRGVMQMAYCASCRKLTLCLTPEQAQEIFGALAEPIESIHLTEHGSARLICADSVVIGDEQMKKE